MKKIDVAFATAKQFVRKLRGGSQPVFLQADDNFLYAVKLLGNPHGSDTSFREAMGSTVYRMCGLPTPAWAAIYISDEFLDRNPGCWFQMPDGPHRPEAGWCFGSRFLGLSEAPLLEILPGSSFSRVSNRLDIWKAWFVDVLCEHSDHRQALFLKCDDGSLEAIFIDHDRMFCGDAGSSPNLEAGRYLDPRIYSEITRKDCNGIEKALKSLNRAKLEPTLKLLPVEWVTPTGLSRLNRFLFRAHEKMLLHDLSDCALRFSKAWEIESGREVERGAASRKDAFLRHPVQSEQLLNWGH